MSWLIPVLGARWKPADMEKSRTPREMLQWTCCRRALVIPREGYDRLTKTVSVVNMRVSGVDEE